MKTLRFRFLVALILILISGVFNVASAEDLFYGLELLCKEKCKTSDYIRIEKITKDEIVFQGGKKLKKENLAEIYGQLKVGNYGVIAHCKDRVILIVLPGGPNGPAIY